MLKKSIMFNLNQFILILSYKNTLNVFNLHTNNTSSYFILQKHTKYYYTYRITDYKMFQRKFYIIIFKLKQFNLKEKELLTGWKVILRPIVNVRKLTRNSTSPSLNRNSLILRKKNHWQPGRLYLVRPIVNKLFLCGTPRV